MELHSNEPFWLLKNGFARSYPVCDQDTRAEVAVIGGGITGALTAYALAKAGLDVVVIEKRHPGMGSTAASTALLQYEIDEPLHSLKDMVGEKRAACSYLACYEAIDSIREILEKEKIEADFKMVPSLQYASYKKHTDGLRKEYQARKKLGLAVELLEPDDLEREYGFKAPLALYSAKAGRIDAYRAAHGLLGLPLDNLRVYDCSEVSHLETGKKNVKLGLASGLTVTCRHAVIACGYESLKYLPFSVATIGTTYALVTKPLPPESLWKDEALLWETKDPYLYIRTTGDGRVLMGGRDDNTHNPKKIEKTLPRKIKGLHDDLEALFPGLPIQIDFSWAGAFASTKDALGYVGSVSVLPNVYFNLGYGGNGILYSQIGAEIIRDSILGRKNVYASVFEFGR